MSEWEMVRLGDVCEIARGGSPRPIEKFITNEPDGINWIKIGDTQLDSKYITQTKEKIKPEGLKKSRFVEEGDFLLSNSMSFGRPYILKLNGCIHDGWLVLKDSANVFSKDFLYYSLSSEPMYRKFKSLAAGCVVNNLNSEIVRNVTVPLPPLEKQHEIAHQLDEITEIIALRKEQILKLDLLVKAKFVEMFGDPVENPMGWEVEPFGKTGKFKNGMNFASDETGITIPYLGVGDFKNLSKIIGISALGEVSLTEMPAEDYLLKNDDIVFVRSNGNKNLVGRCIAVYPNDTELTFSGFCIRYRNTNQKFKTSFLLELLKHKSSREMMLGRGANIQNLNQQILNALPVSSPPLHLQEQFAHYVQTVEEAKKEMDEGLAKMELLYQERMQRWFDPLRPCEGTSP